MASSHEHRAEVGIADAELTVCPGRLGNLVRREVGEADGDVHRRDNQLCELLELLDVEGVIRPQELHQVDAGQVARRVVQVNVLGAVSNDYAAHHIGVVAWLSQVVSRLESARLPGDEPNSLVGVVRLRRQYDLDQALFLRRQEEADDASELAERTAGNAEVEARTVAAVNDLRAVLAGVPKSLLLRFRLVNAARDPQRAEQLLDAENQLL